jgi:hypothetical protein
MPSDAVLNMDPFAFGAKEENDLNRAPAYYQIP